MIMALILQQQQEKVGDFYLLESQRKSNYHKIAHQKYRFGNRI